MIYSFPTHSANYGNRLSEKSESFFVLLEQEIVENKNVKTVDNFPKIVSKGIE